MEDPEPILAPSVSTACHPGRSNEVRHRGVQSKQSHAYNAHLLVQRLEVLQQQQATQAIQSTSKQQTPTSTMESPTSRRVSWIPKNVAAQFVATTGKWTKESSKPGAVISVTEITPEVTQMRRPSYKPGDAAKRNAERRRQSQAHIASISHRKYSYQPDVDASLPVMSEYSSEPVVHDVILKGTPEFHRRLSSNPSSFTAMMDRRQSLANPVDRARIDSFDSNYPAKSSKPSVGSQRSSTSSTDPASWAQQQEERTDSSSLRSVHFSAPYYGPREFVAPSPSKPQTLQTLDGELPVRGVQFSAPDYSPRVAKSDTENARSTALEANGSLKMRAHSAAGIPEEPLTALPEIMETAKTQDNAARRQTTAGFVKVL